MRAREPISGPKVGSIRTDFQGEADSVPAALSTVFQSGSPCTSRAVGSALGWPMRATAACQSA